MTVVNRLGSGVVALVLAAFGLLALALGAEDNLRVGIGHSVQCAVWCAVCSVHCVVCSVQCVVCSVQWAVYRVYSPLYNAHCSV